MDQDPQKSRAAASGGVTPGGGPSSQGDKRPKTAAERKREQRARQTSTESTTVGGRGVADKVKSLGNRWRFDFGPLGKAGESVSAKEAEEQLFHAHVAAVAILGSEVNLDELKPEFEVLGESVATVANHMWPPLRLIIRFIAPLVLVGALIAIWAAILSETPWFRRLGSWLGSRDEQPRPAAEETPPSSTAGTRPHVVHEPAPAAPVEPAAAEDNGAHPPVPNLREMRQRR